METRETVAAEIKDVCGMLRKYHKKPKKAEVDFCISKELRTGLGLLFVPRKDRLQNGDLSKQVGIIMSV